MKKVFLAYISSLLIFVGSAQAIEPQLAQNWCWASSVQNVLAQAGVYKSQLEISVRLDGWPQDRPARTDELILLLQSYGFRAWEVRRPGSPQELYDTLKSGWKIIALAKPSNNEVGHYIVLEGMSPDGSAIIVADPLDGSTRYNSLQQLYYGWRWVSSIVVGAPIMYDSFSDTPQKMDDFTETEDIYDFPEMEGENGSESENDIEKISPHGYRVPEWMR